MVGNWPRGQRHIAASGTRAEVTKPMQDALKHQNNLLPLHPAPEAEPLCGG